MTQATAKAKRNPETNENEPQSRVVAFPSSAEGRFVLDEIVRRAAQQILQATVGTRSHCS